MSEKLFKVMLVIHIAGGMLALLGGLVAMLTKKGMKAHRISGKIFFWGMTAACTSALYLSVAHPNLFLFAIAIFSYQLVAIGYRSLFLKEAYRKNLRPKFLDWVVALLPALVHLFLVVYAFNAFADRNLQGIIPLVFGLIGLGMSRSFIIKFFRPTTDKNLWLFSHFQSMGAAYIATATAFIVVNVQFLPAFITWLAPTLVGSLLITITSIKYRRRLNPSKE